EVGWQAVGLLAAVWMSLAAIRETSLRTAALVYSKPQPTERLVLARFVGGIAPVLGVLIALFLGAFLARLFSGADLAGVTVYLTQTLRAVEAILFAGGAAFCLALLFDNALAGSLIGLLWIILLAGRAFLPKAFFPAYSQNAIYFALLGVALVLMSALLHRRGRRGALPAPVWLMITIVPLFAFPIWALYGIAQNSHDPQIR